MPHIRKTITAQFIGAPGDQIDEKCHAIFEAHGCKFFNQGTWIDTNEREVEFIVDDDKIDAVTEALNALACSVCVDDVDDDALILPLME